MQGFLKCSRCKYRRFKQEEAYFVLYQTPCRLVYGYCKKDIRDKGFKVKGVGKIDGI